MARLLLQARHCRPVIAVVSRRIMLGHSVAPRGTRYTNHLEGLVRHTHKNGAGCAL
jgi:hypothetical protein